MDQPLYPDAPEASDDEAARMAAEAMERQRQTVQTLISHRLRDAIDARQNSGIEDIWLEDDDQYNGYDELNPPTQERGTKEVTQRVTNKGRRSTVFVNITKPKTDTAVSRVTERCLPHDDKPWEYLPTPVPELEEAAKGRDLRQIQLADGTTESSDKVAKVALLEAKQKAKKAESYVEDWYVEGRVYSEMRKVLRDAGRIGTGVLKGPFPTMRKDRKWSVEGGVSRLINRERLAPTSKCISAWDLFPDPACGDDIHAGSYIFDRDYLSNRRVRELAGLPGYDRKAIAEVLQEGPRNRARTFDRYVRQKTGQTPEFDAGTFEVFFYYGDIPPEDLIAGGFEVAGLTHDEEGKPSKPEDLEQMLQLVTVPIVATLINDRIVRMTMNPLETGEFPFDVLPWEPVEGQPWGRGIPRKMRTAQIIVNSSTRAMLENGGMAKGPQVVTAKGVVVPWDGNYTVEGRKGWHFNPTELIDDVRKAFAFLTFPSAQVELQNIINFGLQMADETSNLPLITQGAQGSAPDTVGGMAMLDANATSPLKATAKIADDFMFEPHSRRYYSWLMQDPNVPEDAKGDFQVKARASSALIQRDMAAALLPQILPLSKDPAFGLSPEKTMDETLRANKFDPSAVALTDDEKAQAAEAAGQQPQDPRIVAAQITAEGKAADREAKSRDAELDRQSALLIKELEREIQVMEFAGNRQIAFEDLKAMLTKTALDLRTKQSMQDKELAYAAAKGERTGEPEGI